MFCEINLYKINNFDLKTVYKKRLPQESLNLAELKRKAYAFDAILLNNNEILSYTHQDKSETVDFYSINDTLQTQLLQLYLKKEKKIFDILTQNIENLKIGKHKIIRKVTGNVVKLDNFYLSLDIKQSIISQNNLLKDLLYKDKNQLINKKVKPLNSENTAIIKNITYPDEKDYPLKLKTILEKKNYKDYPDEPIIDIVFNSNQKIYFYFASQLRLIYSPDDLKTKLVIPNFKRKEIIKNAIIKSNIPYLNPKPYKSKYYMFNPVKFTGFKETTHLSALLIKKDETTTIYPKRIPPVFKKEPYIKVIILKDPTINTLKNKNYIAKLFKGLKSIPKIKFELLNKNDFNVEFSAKSIINKVLQYKPYTKIPPLVITIGKKDANYYEDMKRKLFKYGFISQNIIYNNLISSGDFEINNLLLQILSKYGLYPYVINLTHPYDYIIGIDVGNDRYGNRNIAGGISVINKNGILEKLIPLKLHTNGEKVDLSLFIEELSVYLPLRDKNILILRDGKLTPSEKKSVLKEFDNLNIKKITFMNIVKRHSLRIYDDYEGKKGIILKDNLALLLAHQIEGARTLKIDVKSVIENKTLKDIPITKSDLELLFNLTHLNYSNLFIRSKRLRLPAPIHYSDKFVKALGKGWEIKTELLLNGFLYFL